MRRRRQRSRPMCSARCARATRSWSRARSARRWGPSSRLSHVSITARAPTTPRKVDPMFYWLADLSGTISVFNVFRYLTVRTGGSMITALIFVVLCGAWIIDHLRVRQGKGHAIRADGPQTHFVKAGTPTMGGMIVLL